MEPDGVEPTRGDQQPEPTPLTEASGSDETLPDARAEVIARLEAGEPLTVELYTQYQVAAEQVAFKTEGDFSLQQMEVSLECAELFLRADMKARAIEAMNDLVDEITNQADAPAKYDPFVSKVKARIAELGSQKP